MADSLKHTGRLAEAVIVAAMTSTTLFAQDKVAQTGTTVDNPPAEPGFVSGSPFLWLLFVIVCIVVVFAIIRRKRNN